MGEKYCRNAMEETRSSEEMVLKDFTQEEKETLFCLLKKISKNTDGNIL